MRRQTIIGIAVICAAMLATASPARVLVSSGSGQVDLVLYDFLDFVGSGGHDLTATYPVGFPEAMTRTQTGPAPELPDEDVAADGYNEVTYDVHNTLLGALMDVSVIAETEPAGRGGGGMAQFEITFTTIEDFNYEFRATVGRRGPHGFVAEFNGIKASAYYDQLGEYSGTFPTIDGPGGTPIAFDEFVDTGHLPAGTYTFSAAAFSGIGRSGDPLNSSGTATLTLIPEPITAGTSLLGLGALMFVLRRRRQD